MPFPDDLSAASGLFPTAAELVAEERATRQAAQEEAIRRIGEALEGIEDDIWEPVAAHDAEGLSDADVAAAQELAGVAEDLLKMVRLFTSRLKELPPHQPSLPGVRH